MDSNPTKTTDRPTATVTKESARRRALAKLGLAAGAAYFAPTLVHLDRASVAIAAPACPPGYTYSPSQKKCIKNSDARLKRDIVPVARLANGIGLYRYRYHWSEQLYVGVMAQEVAAIVPDAVARGASGFLEVDYAQLGIELVTWEQWQAAQDAAVAA